MIPLLVIRHGKTDWNAENRLQGQTDRPLSEAGRKSVESWRMPPPYAGFSCVSSPLIRATETARILGLNPTIETALTEMSWGDWEGENWRQLQQSLGPDVMAAHQARGLDFCPPNGESPRHVQNRLRTWLTGLSRPTVAISHKGVLQVLYSLATGWQMTDKSGVRFSQGEGFLFQVSDGMPRLAQQNIPLGQA